MTNIQTIQHVDDCVPLYLPHSLYLKPLARMNISVALPVNKTGKSISNLDIMDKLSAALKPDKFFVIKVAKNTIDFIRFEAELEQRSRLRSAIARIDGISLKIAGFSEPFRVRACEAKDEFPTRHDWDSFFRDASNMDEMKAGERPDTIHITHLPIRWFCPRHAEQEDKVKPSESIFKRIFEKFGSIRCVDIPICDPYRNKMNSDINGMKTFSFEQDVLFEGYVQFDEYVGFTRAMDEFRGMKLVRKYIDKTLAININVTFDKEKHLSDAQMQRRERVRNRLIAKVRAEEEDKERQKKLEQEKLDRQRQNEEQEKLAELERQREREEKRKMKHLKKIQERGQVEISQEIRVEERKLMIAQRKLESIRVLEALFDRMRLKHLEKHTKTRRDGGGEYEREKARVRLVEKYKVATEDLVSKQRVLVQELKSKTPLLGLLSKKSKKQQHSASSDDEAKGPTKKRLPTNHHNSAGTENAAAAVAAAPALAPVNPFKAVAALAAAGAGGAAPYTTSEAASEWMKSLTMLPYVPSMFPPHPHLYRPQLNNFSVSPNYRGFAPRMRGRGRGRGGRGRGGYNNGQSSSSYYNSNYKNFKYDDNEYDDDDGSDDDHHRRSSRSSRRYSRSRRSRSYSRRKSSTRSRSRNHSSRPRRSHTSSRSRSSRSHSRTRTRRSHSRHRRSYTRSRSRTKSHTRKSKSPHSRSHSRSRSKSHTASASRGNAAVQPAIPPQRLNKKLVSTRRSRSTVGSDWSRSRSRSPPSRSHRGVVIETDKLVRSAEEIKRTIEKNMQEKMREEEREIKETFRHRKRHDSQLIKATSIASSGNDDGGGNGVVAVMPTEHSPLRRKIDEDHQNLYQDEDLET